MVRSSDSDPAHRAITKNGQGQRQDRDLRDLRDVVDANRQANEDQHADIVGLIAEIRAELHSRGTVGKFILGLVAAGIGTVITIIILGANRLDDVEDRIHEAQSESRQHEREGLQIGRSLRHDVEENHEDIRELQKFHRVKPGRD